MRKLMLGTAMILPLMMGPAFAQDTATTPAPADPATDATTAPMGTDAAPAAEMPAGENTEAAADAAAEADVAASGKVEQEQAANELRIDWITDATVNSPEGEAIGEINDVIIDGEAGTVKAAVIGVGGFLGIGEKQIAVPWDQLTINYDAQEISSDLTKEEAEAAPEYVFREQEAAPDAMGTEGAAGGGMATDGTMATTPDSAAATTDPAMAGTAPATTTDPAMTGTDAATTTTTEPMEAPADTAETPATPPTDAAMEPEDDAAAEPAEGTTPATN